jgi:hypothetical protein
MKAALVLLVIAGSFVAVPVQAQKRPWEWSDEERIARRSDPVLARERVASSRQVAGSTIRSDTTAMMLKGDVINGNVHPELFLPVELFSIFINAAFAPSEEDRSIYRQASAERSSQPIPADFWLRLEELTHEYNAVMAEARGINKRAGVSTGAERERLMRESEVLQARQCARLARALEQSRVAFGKAEFDRFLYEAVAPTAVIALAEPSTPAQLVYLNEGCR